MVVWIDESSKINFVGTDITMVDEGSNLNLIIQDGSIEYIASQVIEATKAKIDIEFLYQE